MSEIVGSDKERLWILMMSFLNRFWVDLKIQFHSRSMSDATFSDMHFKNKVAWGRTTLNCHQKMIFIIGTKREKCAYMLLFLFRSTSWMFYSDVLLIVFVLNKLVWTGSIQLRSCHRPIAVLLSSQMWANWMITFRHPDTFLKTCRPIKTTFRPINRQIEVKQKSDRK